MGQPLTSGWHGCDQHQARAQALERVADDEQAARRSSGGHHRREHEQRRGQEQHAPLGETASYLHPPRPSHHMAGIGYPVGEQEAGFGLLDGLVTLGGG
jgi:hypothetical protein